MLRAYARLARGERGSYRLVRLVRRLRPQDRWRDRFTLPGGMRMDLDLATYPDCCMAFGLYELATARLIRRLLRRGDHFVDAGANIGYFTLLAARRVGPEGRVDAFEPEPVNRQRLLDHLAMNELADRVHVHAAALSDAAGSAVIHGVPEPSGTFNHGCASIYPPAGVRTTCTAVPTVRMDDVLDGCRVRLVKMDVEGAEPLVTGGMAGLLDVAIPPVIIGELNPMQSAAAGFPPSEWVRRVLAMRDDYRLYLVGSRPRRIAFDSAWLDRLGQVNLMLCPGRVGGGGRAMRP